VPDNLKAEVEKKAEALVAEFLKPQFIKPPPKNWRFNYIIDIHSKWHRSFFYFIATYRSRGPTAIKPTFEAPFARLEYIGNRRFNCTYMRHTGQWWEVHQSLSRIAGTGGRLFAGLFHRASWMLPTSLATLWKQLTMGESRLPSRQRQKVIAAKKFGEPPKQARRLRPSPGFVMIRVKETRT
jgi:hypothetical protein